MTYIPNYYEILGLPKDIQHESEIPAQTLRSAYRRALLQNHPDKTSPLAKPSVKTNGSIYTIDQIAEAFNVLSIPKARAEYNKELKLQTGFGNTGRGVEGRQAFHTGVETLDLDDLEIDEAQGIWYRSCRCGDGRGFLVTEDDLEEAADEGELHVGCRGCSLWLKVLFGVIEEDSEAAGEATFAPVEVRSHRPGAQPCRPQAGAANLAVQIQAPSGLPSCQLAVAQQVHPLPLLMGSLSMAPHSSLSMRALSTVIDATILSSSTFIRPAISAAPLSLERRAFSSAFSRSSTSKSFNFLRNTAVRPAFRQLRISDHSKHSPSIATSIRHCSYRRHNMCKLHGGTEADSAAIDVTKGRELLPANVVPTHYDLTVEPDFKKFTYEGTVIVDLDVAEDSTSISLNTLELDIHSTKVTSGSQTISSSPSLSYDESSQTTKVTFENSLKKGSKAQLEMTFTGQLNDKMAGFYRSTYKNADGSEGVLATTQMEPTDARRAFPCFDEPSLKAEFTISLIADKKLTCLSNMDVASESEIQSKISGTTKKVVKFNKSPRMSTYLVAFIVGELNYIETDKFRLPVRVYAPPNQDIEHGRFSLELAARTLAFYEKTFDSAFPLPKMDMVAIPDFAAGAMENWGLITYRVVDVLFDEKTSGASTKERVAEVVQHELAHQWFGNLVTMDFWDGLWLNEGFATWMSWYSCNIFFPEWKVWQSYVTDTLQGALSLDSLRSSHPIEVPVKKADEVNQIFDAISYSKGSCVLRMISKYLGEDVFMEGIRQYLKKHAYGNTQTGDLWAALGAASGKNLEETMDIWTKHVGYPVVSVTENEKDNTIHVKQNRLLRTADVKPEEDKVLYPVFLGLRTKDGVNEELVLSERENNFKVPNLDFFKLNADHSGIYRTSYTPARLEKLGQAARDGLLSVEDRTGMIADAGALAACGYQKTSGVLNLLKGFDSETEFVVWNEIISRLGAIQGAWIFEDQKIRDGLETFQRDLVSEKAHKAGWVFKDGDDHIQQQFKGMLFGSAGMSGDDTVRRAAKDMFAKFAAGDKSAIHPNIRGSVYGMALKYGGKAEYDVLLDTYRKSVNADERNTALRTLGRSKDPELIKRTLELPFSGEVKEQDVYLPLSALRTHPEGIEALYQWMTVNFDELARRFPAGLSMLGTLVSICTSSFAKKADLERVQKFFENKSLKGFDQSLAQACDAIKAKDAWLSRDRQDIKEWVEAYQAKTIKSEL